MSYGIDSKKLKKFIDFYSPFNNGEQLKFLTLFKGEEGLLRYLQTSPFQGIDSTSVQQRKIWFGSNDMTELKQKQNMSGAISKLLLNPFKTIQMKMYFCFSIIHIIQAITSEVQLQKYLLSSILLNFLVLLCTYLIELVPQAYRYYENLKIKSYAFGRSKVVVWRDNEKIQIDSFDLVVGDIVQIKPGDVICADGLIIQGHITVKEPLSYKLMITEKSKTKYCLRKWIQFEEKVNDDSSSQKYDLKPSPIILAGSEVSKGDGKYVVICVGKYSRIGYFISQINRLAIQRPSLLQSKVQRVIFEISKYIVLVFIFFVILYVVKVSVFIIIEKSILKQNWRKILNDFLNGLEIFLIGSPITHTIGLFLGGSFIRYDMYKTDNIWFKYVKDCGSMKDISCLIFDKFEQIEKIKLVQIWNEDFQQIQKNQQESQGLLQRQQLRKNNEKYEQMLIDSLKCQDISPHAVGLKIPSFFIGSNKRFITYIEIALQEYANQKILSSLMEQKIVYSDGDIQNSGLTQYQHFSTSSANHKQIENVYIKGHSETLLKQCTHIMNKYTGQIVFLSTPIRDKIFQIICKMNSIQQPSLITGFIEVNPNHPKFREADYRVIMLSLIAYKQKHDSEEFQSLGKIKDMGVTITLIGNRGHQQTLAMGKQLGLVIMDKPSVQLKGYGFNKIVGGIICKNCKKSCCVCSNREQYEPILKNQDQFNRTYKHLHVVSQVNGIEKLTLTVGYSSANQRALYIGKNIHDVPAMKTSSLAGVYKFQIEDKYANYASDLILPNNKLFTIQKIIEWSYHYYSFYRRFLVFLLTSLLVGFISSVLSFLLYNTVVINIIQYLWVAIIFIPILGLGFTFLPQQLQNVQKKDFNDPLIDRVSYRQISSQVIIQTLIIFIILVTGHNFIPEDYDSIDSIIQSNWAAKYSDPQKTKICSGINDNIFNNRQQVYYRTFNLYGFHSRHLTFIFNLYALMQLMNYLNCFHLVNRRDIRSNNNNFTQILDKRKIGIIFSAVVALGGQIVVTCFGGEGLCLYPNGLTIKQWAICLGLSLFVIITRLVVKQFPEENYNDEKVGRIWVNRSYNLSVMAPKAKQSLQDFEMDEELEIKKMAMINE